MFLKTCFFTVSLSHSLLPASGTALTLAKPVVDAKSHSDLSVPGPDPGPNRSRDALVQVKESSRPIIYY